MGKIAGVVFLSLVQFRLFAALHSSTLPDISRAAHEVLLGTPQHQAFQNRLLGPWAAQAVTWLTGWSYHSSHTVVLLLLCIAANVLAFSVFKRLSGSADFAFRYTVYFLGAALALLSMDWVFVWDFVEMIVFLLFAYGVFSRQHTLYFCGVFAAAILNRESALFIAAWLVLDGFAGEHGRLGWRLRDTARAAIGVSLLLVGVAYTLAIRHWLFVRSSLADRDGSPLPVVGNQWNLAESGRKAIETLLTPNVDLPIVIHIGWLLLAAFFVRHWRELAAYRSACVIVLLMWAAVPTFGFFDETRQYLYMLPFLLMFDLAVRGRLVPAGGSSSQIG